MLGLDLALVGQVGGGGVEVAAYRELVVVKVDGVVVVDLDRVQPQSFTRFNRMALVSMGFYKSRFNN
jgi:hypothetical protein